MAAKRRFQDRVEEKYILKRVEGIADGEFKGSGAYGIVRLVSVKGNACIAKRIHDILKDPRVPPADRESVKEKFEKECKMLSELRHPNIVHFVGVHYDKRGDMSLIMEALHSDLRGFFFQKPPSISVKLDILLDVSYGLLYLHSQHPTPIIHRDLNPGNVLLTRNLKAKIADLGVSSYLSFSKAQTMAPGAWDYMPPEALRKYPNYDTSLDVFSFGHVALCVGNHKSVNIIIPPSRAVYQTPIKQRKKYLDSLGHKHCLYSMIVDCLHEQTRKRPSTRDLCDKLQWLNCTHAIECVTTVNTEDKSAAGTTGSAPLSPSSDTHYKDHMSGTSPHTDHTSVTSPHTDNHQKQEFSDERISSLQQKIDELTVENEKLKIHAETEKAQAQVYKSDFEIERSDRAKAHGAIEDYKFQLARLQEKFIQKEDKYIHQHAEIYVLKAANTRQAEELRALRLNQFYAQEPTPKPRQGTDNYHSPLTPSSNDPIVSTKLSPSHLPPPHVPQAPITQNTDMYIQTA